MPSSIPSSDNTCHPLEEETCCNQLSLDVPDVDKERVCQKLGCSFNNCVTSSPSFDPTTTSTDSPTYMPSTVGPTKSVSRSFKLLIVLELSSSLLIFCIHVHSQRSNQASPQAVK